MKTDIDKTWEVLNSYFLNTDTMKINEDYLNHLLDVEYFSNDSSTYHEIKNTRRKAKSIVWEALTKWVNFHLKYEGYVGYVCTSYQLKSWLNEYGRGYESLAESVETVEAMRSEK